MEDIRSTIESLSQSFSARMAAFESELGKNNVSPSPPSSLSTLAAEFHTFRSFVMDTLKNIEKQVTVLVTECDNIEMRSRRAMLLLHGVPEKKDEDTMAVFLDVASQHFSSATIDSKVICRVSRLGRARQGSPRPLLVKFYSESVRDKLWMAKSSLKGSGITMSEFLTKLRHKVFVAARERVGISRCWTSAGRIIVTGLDGKRHRIFSAADIAKLSEAESTKTLTSSAAAPSQVADVRAPTSKPKRAASAKRK